jgi:hypothetical protein
MSCSNQFFLAIRRKFLFRRLTASSRRRWGKGRIDWLHVIDAGQWRNWGMLQALGYRASLFKWCLLFFGVEYGRRRKVVAGWHRNVSSCCELEQHVGILRIILREQSFHQTFQGTVSEAQGFHAPINSLLPR